MRWWRLVAIMGTAVAGIGGAWIIWTADEAPRWLVACSGFMALAGLAAAVVIAALIWHIIMDDIRPRLLLRKPRAPMALSHREASLIGHRSYRKHPVKFWGGLILGNSFFIGFMTFGKPDHESFKVDENSDE